MVDLRYVRSEDFERDSSLDLWSGRGGATSTADPDLLARAVRAHKAGDALAQAAITVALVLAIGAVAFALGVDRAAAAGLVSVGASLASPTFGLVLVAAFGVLGALALYAPRAALRAWARVPVRPRR